MVKLDYLSLLIFSDSPKTIKALLGSTVISTPSFENVCPSVATILMPGCFVFNSSTLPMSTTALLPSKNEDLGLGENINDI